MSSSDQAPPALFDRRRVRANRQRAVERGMPAFLADAVAEEFAERLAATLRDFRMILIHHSHPAALVDRIRRDRPQAAVFASDVVVDRADLVFDEELQPLARESLDAILCVLGLEQVNDVPGALVQFRQALKPDGLFLGAALGGTSLTELRAAVISAESELSGGASPRIAPFVDVREWGALLQRAGFALPVVDADRLTVRYPDALALMRDLKALGLANALIERKRGMTRPALLARAAAHYSDRFADPDGRVRATLEIVYFLGWSPHESQQQPLRPGSARARLADALGAKETPLNAETASGSGRGSR